MYRRVILVVSLFTIMFAPGEVFGITIRRVKVGGGAGPGSTWANAYGDIQTAITASSASDQVWVAAGTYTPGAAPSGCPITTTGCTTAGNTALLNARLNTFTLKIGVEVYGGFPATGNPV